MNFIFSGSKEKFEQEISKWIEKNDVNKFIDGITKLSPYFSDDEYITVTTYVPETNPDVLECLIPNTNYNINLKAATITILAAILDVNLTQGFASVALSISGFNSHAVVKLNEAEGEKCVVLEMLRTKMRIITEGVLPPRNRECFNINLNCKYRRGNQCKIEDKDIQKIFLSLCDKNVIRENGNGVYKYNL